MPDVVVVYYTTINWDSISSESGLLAEQGPLLEPLLTYWIPRNKFKEIELPYFAFKKMCLGALSANCPSFGSGRNVLT